MGPVIRLLVAVMAAWLLSGQVEAQPLDSPVSPIALPHVRLTPTAQPNRIPAQAYLTGYVFWIR